MACLSSRVPYGEVVSPEKLKMIEQAENVLRDLGFYDVRVATTNCGRRPFHQLSAPRRAKAKAIVHLARIEVGPADMRKFLDNRTSTKVAEALKQIGYAHVTLDLQGYRRGSSNEVLQAFGSQGVQGS